MSEDQFIQTKQTVLKHIQNLFEEIEQEMAMSHQEKYALLEDLFENASDVDELKVAFDQWHSDHSEDLLLEQSADEIWDQALGSDDEGELDDEYDEGEDGEEEFDETDDDELS